MSIFNKRSIGLDIADRTIELVELEKKGDKATVVSRNRIELPEGIVERGRIADQKKLAEAIKKISVEAKPTPIVLEKIIFGLPECLVYTNIFELPPHPKNEKRQEIEKVLATTVPEDPGGLVFYFHTLKDESANRKINKKSTVIVFAAKEDVFTEWLKFFASLGVEIEFFDLESLALGRAIFSANPKNSVGVIDIGAETTNVSIFNFDGLSYSFVVYLGGDEIVDRIAVLKNISRKEAENIKIANGLNGPDKDAASIVKEELLKIASETKQGLDYYQKTNKTKIEKIVLAGGSSKIIGLPDLYQEFIGIPAELAYSPVLESELPFEYLEASGLAERGLGREIWPNEETFDLAPLAKRTKKSNKTASGKKNQEPSKIKSSIIEVIETEDEKEESEEKAERASEQTAQISELNAVIEKKLKKQKLMLIAVLGIGLVLVGGAFYYRSQQNAKTQADIERRLNQLGYVRSYDLRVPIAVKAEEYTTDRVKGRIVMVTVENGTTKDEAITQAKELAVKGLADGEKIIGEALNQEALLENPTFPLEIQWLAYQTDNLEGFYINEFNKINSNNIKYSINSLELSNYEASENPGVFYLDGRLTVTLDQPLER
jgi:type IV pilus assembly protein PilM